MGLICAAFQAVTFRSHHHHRALQSAAAAAATAATAAAAAALRRPARGPPNFPFVARSLPISLRSPHRIAAVIGRFFELRDAT